MGCGCGKKKVATQPKKVVKTPERKTTDGTGIIKRIRRTSK